jgi:histidine triad (HIT) family protein
MYDQNNIFACILRGDISCQKAGENDTTLAFYDIHPKAPTHILVIPKGAYTALSDFCLNASPEEITGFWHLVGQLTIEHTLTNGLRLISNEGTYGGQEVPHFHIHLLGGKHLGQMLA